MGHIHKVDGATGGKKVEHQNNEADDLGEGVGKANTHDAQFQNKGEKIVSKDIKDRGDDCGQDNPVGGIVISYETGGRNKKNIDRKA